jgi:hypothetical protein
MTTADWIQMVAASLAACAAIISAFSAWLSLRATRAVEEQAEVTKSLAAYDLVRSFERDYADHYDEVFAALGPWPDEVAVDPDKRRVVNELLQNLSSAYLAAEMGLLSERTRDYIFALFLDWVQVPEARAIWTDVFRVQGATFPVGFVDFLDARLAASVPSPPEDVGDDAAAESSRLEAS